MAPGDDDYTSRMVASPSSSRYGNVRHRAWSPKPRAPSSSQTATAKRTHHAHVPRDASGVVEDAVALYCAANEGASVEHMHRVLAQVLQWGQTLHVAGAATNAEVVERLSKAYGDIRSLKSIIAAKDAALEEFEVANDILAKHVDLLQQQTQRSRPSSPEHPSGVPKVQTHPGTVARGEATPACATADHPTATQPPETPPPLVAQQGPVNDLSNAMVACAESYAELSVRHEQAQLSLQRLRKELELHSIELHKGVHVAAQTKELRLNIRRQEAVVLEVQAAKEQEHGRLRTLSTTIANASPAAGISLNDLPAKRPTDVAAVMVKSATPRQRKAPGSVASSSKGSATKKATPDQPTSDGTGSSVGGATKNALGVDLAKLMKIHEASQQNANTNTDTDTDSNSDTDTDGDGRPDPEVFVNVYRKTAEASPLDAHRAKQRDAIAALKLDSQVVGHVNYDIAAEKALLIRRRWNAASYTSHGRDSAALFLQEDKNHNGSLDLAETLLAFRRVLHLTTEEVSDAEVRTLFNSIDVDRSGSIGWNELNAFLQPGTATIAAATTATNGNDENDRNTRNAMAPTTSHGPMRQGMPEDARKQALEDAKRQAREQLARQQQQQGAGGGSPSKRRHTTEAFIGADPGQQTHLDFFKFLKRQGLDLAAEASTLDINGDGLMDCHDVEDACRLLGFNLPSKRAEALFKYVAKQPHADAEEGEGEGGETITVRQFVDCMGREAINPSVRHAVARGKEALIEQRQRQSSPEGRNSLTTLSKHGNTKVVQVRNNQALGAMATDPNGYKTREVYEFQKTLEDGWDTHFATGVVSKGMTGSSRNMAAKSVPTRKMSTFGNVFAATKAGPNYKARRSSISFSQDVQRGSHAEVVMKKLAVYCKREKVDVWDKFSCYDQFGDGYIEPKFLKRALNDLGLEVSTAESNFVFKNYVRPTADGKIKVQDIHDAICKFMNLVEV